MGCIARALLIWRLRLQHVNISGSVVFAPEKIEGTMTNAPIKKIQAIKTLRDRAATEGEKDAAQHKLTLILAKYQLTEQDIPDPHFSTRGRPSFRPRSAAYESAQSFQETFDATMRDFRRAAEAEQRRARQTSDEYKTWTGSFGDEPSRGRTTADPPPRKSKGKINSRQRFEQALGAHVTNIAWRYVKREHVHAARSDAPPNKAAYARAFYEASAYTIRARMTNKLSNPPMQTKSKNAEGIRAGMRFGDRANLGLFPLNDF